MKKKRGKQGQFIIFAVLLITIMIISIGVIMYSTVTYFKHERWNEYLSLIDNLRVSSRHLMEINLANFTKTSFEQRAPDRSAISQILNQWKNDLKIGLAGSGVTVDFLNTSQLLSSPKIVGETYIPERSVYNFIKCYWYYPVSISSFYADLLINLTNFGLYGYRYPILVSLSIELDISYLTDAPTQISELVVNVTRENGLSVTDLTTENFLVYRFDPSIEEWTTANLSTVKRISGGYRLVFENTIEQPYYKWLIVTVEDNRDITAVSSTYTSIDFIVEKGTPTSGRPADTDDEIYTLEAGVKGQWYWNGRQLNVQTEGGAPLILPPIPPIPIKQFRVNVTENGVGSTSSERACQYEIWDKINWHGRFIDVPKNLADPYYRFNSTNRMVFQVNFTNLGITRQKATILWNDDLDVAPYQGPSDLEYFPGFYEAKTNVYRVEFMDTENSDPRPVYAWPYYGVAALLLKDPNTGECYGPWNIHGFDLASTPPGTAKWRPYGQWEIKYWYGGSGAKATVRLIAILNSTQVQNVWQFFGSDDPRSNYYDTYAVVFLTANVKYLQQRVWVYWKENQTGHGLWLSWEWGKGETVYYAYLDNQTGEVAGPYTYDYSWGAPNHIEYDYPGYWATHWNDQMGRGLIFNVDGLNNLYGLNESRTCFSVTHWAPDLFFLRYKQGSIEYEAIQCDYDEGNPEEYTVVTGTNYSYISTMWMYGGGGADGYQEVDDYHYMFLESYSPKIIITEES